MRRGAVSLGRDTDHSSIQPPPRLSPAPHVSGFTERGAPARPGCQRRAAPRIRVRSLREPGVARRKRQQQVCKDGATMKVRHLLLLARGELSGGFVNAVPVFQPCLAPSLSPPSLLSCTCAVSSPPLRFPLPRLSLPILAGRFHAYPPSPI